MEELAEGFGQLNVGSLKEKVLRYQGKKECFLIWIFKVQDDQDFKKIIEESLNEDILSIFEEKLETLLFTQLFSAKINLVFLYIYTNQIPSSNEFIESATSLLDKIAGENDLTLDPGIQMKVKGARIALHSLKTLRDIQQGVHTLNHETRLPDNPKVLATFKMLERQFLAQVRVYGQEKELVEEAIGIDPDWEWLLIKSKLLRWETRGKGHWDAKPPEVETLESALDLNPNHPFCQIRGCEVLSQLAFKGPFPLTLSNATYNRKEDVMKYLKDKAIEFENEFPYPGWLNAFARIFSENDFKLSTRLLEKALKIAPNSSKINHRMAILFKNQKKFPESEDYIRKAVRSAYRNYPALLDKAKLLLRRQIMSHEIQEELQELFSNITATDGYRSSSYVALLFLKGYFLFKIMKDMEGAIKTWVVWADADVQETSLGFKNLYKLQFWGWTVNCESLVANVRQQLQIYRRQYPEVNVQSFDLLLVPPPPRRQGNQPQWNRWN